MCFLCHAFQNFWNSSGWLSYYYSDFSLSYVLYRHEEHEIGSCYHCFYFDSLLMGLCYSVLYACRLFVETEFRIRPMVRDSGRSVTEFEQGWDYMQRGIIKLKNILEGLPEPQFTSEIYMMLYTYPPFIPFFDYCFSFFFQ